MAKSPNIRIAQNTAIIYVRMVVTILVGLITSRLVLQALGATDVGIYSAVGSTVALISFITGALTATTVRFMNFEMGKKDGDTNRIFNICHVIHLGGAGVLFLLLEIIGLWYLGTYLNVPPGKEADAMFVFQVSTVVACLGIANVPFQSLFTVHEKFATVAVIDIINALVKLSLVTLLLFCRGNGLRMYAVMMSVTTWIAFIVYHILCQKRWPGIIKWRFVKEPKAYKEVLVFSNWNLLSSASILARSQGSNMLINAFFGPAVNAAYFYAGTVQNYVNQFVANFDTAAAPQITQNIGGGKRERSVALTEKVCRICILLFLLLFFPLWSELDFILRLWLGSGIPEGTVLMCRWTLLVAAVSATSAGLGQLINAIGDIKWYKISFSVLYLGCLLAGWLLFRSGAPAHTVIIGFVAADILCRIIQLILLKVRSGFDVGHFLREAYLRPLAVVTLLLVYLFLYRLLPFHSAGWKLAGIAITLLITALVIFYVGLTSAERHKLVSYLVLKADNPAKGRFVADRAVLKARYFTAFGKPLNLKHPQTFNEKLQWIKLYDRDSRYTELSDKYLAKIRVQELVGPTHIIPTLGVWEHFDQIDFEALPPQFVLKCTHDSGGLVICRDRKEFNREDARAKIETCLKKSFYHHSREWQYKDIPPRIIAEPYMQDGDSRELKDYKFYCFNGKPEFLYLSEGLEDHSTAHISFVTLDWQKAPFRRADYPDFAVLPPKPSCLDQMVEMARKLSSGFRFVRVDLYQINGQVYFGELTFTPTGGFVPFIPDSADLAIGRLLKL